MSNNRQTSMWRLLQKLYRKLLLHFENFESGRPEDLSMSKPAVHTERKERPELGERKVLLPLPVGPVGGQVHWGGGAPAGGSAGAQWGALSASYNQDDGIQESGRVGGGMKKGKQRRKRT